jgi:putative PIN family toxin of toxin-antitoxin system
VSGILFGGTPGRILEAWARGEFDLVVSMALLEEYERVGRRLHKKYPGEELAIFLAGITREAEIVTASPLPTRVCEDPNDDKFLACAVAAKVGTIVSGDRALVATSGYAGIQVLRPSEFARIHLRRR